MDKCLASAMGFARGGVRDKQAVEALGYMIAHDSLPLMTPEKDGFRTFAKALQPLWKPPAESTMTKNLEEKYKKLQEAFARRISKADHLSLTCDLWTHESTMRGYLGLTVHFREGTKMVNVETGIRFMPERKTAANLRVALDELCEDWGIQKGKVRAVLTDGGANIKAAVREEFGADKHVSCVAHTLNHVGQAAIDLELSKAPSETEPHEVVIVPENEDDADELLEDVTDAEDGVNDDDGAFIMSLRPLLMKVKRIVRFFRTSDVASRMLINFQIESGKKEHEALKLIQEVRTRWNSCYFMLERFLLLAEPVSRVLLQLQRERERRTKSKVPNLLSGDQLEVLAEVRDLLKPLAEATLMVSKGNSVTLSDVIPMVYGLKKGIGAFEPSHPVTFNLQQKLLSEINLKFSGIELQRPYAAATMLDPRYKKFVFESPQAVANIVRHLSGRIAEKVAAAGRALEETIADQQAAPPSSSGIWAAVDEALLRKSAGAMDQESAGAMPSQFRAYYNNPVANRRTNPNPLETWCGMKVGLEHVYELAMEYLIIPATSVASERLFSHAGCVATQRRCRLTPKHLDILTFLRSVDKETWFKV